MARWPNVLNGEVGFIALERGVQLRQLIKWGNGLLLC
jgi:hypothetical protein